MFQFSGDTLWWTNSLQWKITMLLMGKSTISSHFPLLFVCSPEGIPMKSHGNKGKLETSLGNLRKSVWISIAKISHGETQGMQIFPLDTLFHHGNLGKLETSEAPWGHGSNFVGDPTEGSWGDDLETARPMESTDLDSIIPGWLMTINGG